MRAESTFEDILAVLFFAKSSIRELYREFRPQANGPGHTNSLAERDDGYQMLSALEERLTAKPVAALPQIAPPDGSRMRDTASPTDRPSDAEVLALLAPFAGNGARVSPGANGDIQVAIAAIIEDLRRPTVSPDNSRRQAADQLERLVARYQTAPSVSSAGAGDTQVAEDAGDRILGDTAERMRAEIMRQAAELTGWIAERPDRMILSVEMELDVGALARAAFPLP